MNIHKLLKTGHTTLQLYYASMT